MTGRALSIARNWTSRYRRDFPDDIVRPLHYANKESSGVVFDHRTLALAVNYLYGGRLLVCLYFFVFFFILVGVAIKSTAIKSTLRSVLLDDDFCCGL